MAGSDDDAAKNEQGDSVISPVLIGMVLAGSFATFALAKGALDLLQRYGSF